MFSIDPGLYYLFLFSIIFSLLSLLFSKIGFKKWSKQIIWYTVLMFILTFLFKIKDYTVALLMVAASIYLVFQKQIKIILPLKIQVKEHSYLDVLIVKVNKLLKKFSGFMKEAFIKIITKIKKAILFLRDCYVNIPYKWLKRFIMFLPLIIALCIGSFFVLDYYTLKVSDYYPKENVSGKVVIRVEFNDEIHSSLPSDQVINYFKISPKIAGDYKIEGKEIIFTSIDDLKPSAQYFVRVDPSKIRSNNKILRKGFSFYIGSEPFRIIYNNLISRKISDTEVKITGEIQTNYPVSPEEFRKHVFLYDPEKKNIEYQIKYYDIKDLYVIEAVINPEDYKIKEGKKDFTLFVDKDLNCIGGQLPLGSDITDKITLYPDSSEVQTKYLFVQRYDILHSEGGNYIAILFSEPLDPKGLKNFFSLSPKISFELLREYKYVLIKADFDPGTDYILNIQGLKSVYGNYLKNSLSYNIKIRDQQPMLKFADGGNILALNGNKNIKMKTVNINSYRIIVKKIYKNNLTDMLKSYYEPEGSTIIIDQKIKVDNPVLNKEENHYLNFDSLVFNSKYNKFPGLYSISIYNTNSGYYGNTSDRKLVLITDLGILTKIVGDDLYIWCLSFSRKELQKDAWVSLVSRNGQILDKVSTGISGYAVIKNYKHKDYFESAFYILAEKGEDFSYLSLSNYSNYYGGDYGDDYGYEYEEEYYEEEMYSSSPVTDNGFFVTTERAVYRPGETVNFTILDRIKSKKTWYETIKRVISYEIKDPLTDSVSSGEFDSGNMNHISYTLPYNSKTGRYIITFKNEGKLLGTAFFSCEEFIPQNIKVDILKTEQKGNKISFKIKAQYLFGGNAGNLKIKTGIHIIKSYFSIPGFEEYSFYDDRKRSFYADSIDLGDAQLDEKGEYDYSFEVPLGLKPPSAVSVVVRADVQDEDGRVVTGVKSFHYDFYDYYFGVRADKKIYNVGDTATVDIISLDAEGNRIARNDVRITVIREKYYTIFNENKIKGYAQESYTEDLQDIVINIPKNGYKLKLPVDTGGKYFVYVGDLEDSSASFSFNTTIGGGVEDDEDIANRFTIIMDKKKYNIGETATAYVKSKVDGIAFIFGEADDIYFTKLIGISNGSASFSFPVEKEYFPNFYISGIILTDDIEKWETSSLSCIEKIVLNPKEAEIPVDLEVETKTNTTKGIHVRIKVPDNFQNSDFMIYAVDEGALQVDEYHVQNPGAFFYANRLLQVITKDNLYQLLPDFSVLNAKKVGGDYSDETKSAKSEAMERHLNPIFAKRVKVFSLCSGIVKPDENGYIQWDISNFDEFNGLVRLTVIGATQNKFIKVEKQITVVDDFTIMIGLTRVFGPRDELSFPVQIFNNSEKTQEIKVDIKIEGPVSFSDSNKGSYGIPSGGQVIIPCTIKGKDDIGKAVIQVQLNSGGAVYEKNMEFAVRPYTSYDNKQETQIVLPAKSVIVKSDKTYYAFGYEGEIIVGNNPLIQILTSLDKLAEFPYGCTEQLVSKTFPFLYMGTLVDEINYSGFNKILIKKTVQEVIQQISFRQLSDGSFSLWPGSSYSYEWVSDYATHFLFEASKQGYSVPKKVLDKAKSYILQEFKQTGSVERYGIPSKSSYSIYNYFLQAYLGKPDYNYMEHIRMNKLSTLSISEKCLLASAYALIGEKEKAGKIIDTIDQNTINSKPETNYYLFYDSYLRNFALYIYALSYLESDPQKLYILFNNLIDKVVSAQNLNTQENAWILITIFKLYSQCSQILEKNNPRYEVFIDGNSQGVFDNPQKNIKLERPFMSVEIKNSGNGEIYFHTRQTGFPKDIALLYSKDQPLDCKRVYYNTKGKPVDLKSVKKGDLLLVVSSVEAGKNYDLNGTIIVDILPSCFEVENPRLDSNSKTKFQISYSSLYYGDYSYFDLRDDRIIVAPQYNYNRFVFSYVVRVTGVGAFEIPPLYVEKMYDVSVKGYSQTMLKLVSIAP